MAITINNVGGYAASASVTDMTVVSSADLEQGDSVETPNGELLWVARVLTSTTIIVQREYAGSTISTIDDGATLVLEVADTEVLNDMSSGADWTTVEETASAMTYGSPATSIGANKGWAYYLTGLLIAADWARAVFSIDYKIDHQGTTIFVGFTADDPPLGYQDVATPVVQDGYMFKPVFEGVGKVTYHKRLAGVASSSNLQDDVITDSANWRRVSVSLAKIGSTIEISGTVDRDAFGVEVGANIITDSADLHDGALYPFISGYDGFTNRTNNFRNAKLQIFGAAPVASDDWPFGTAADWPFTTNTDWPLLPNKPWGPTIE